MNIEKEKLEKLILESNSKSEICRKIGVSNNGVNFKKLDILILSYGLNIDSFRKSKNHIVKYEKIQKICPICKVNFETQKGHKREKETCSHSCANSFFRSGINNPNYKNIDQYDVKNRNYSRKYRQICFNYHEHKCVICNENLMLDVHHLDGNKKNNNPENLIPMCATHHNYWHSQYRYLIEEQVNNYINNYIIESVL
jgi:hypothetical protein